MNGQDALNVAGMSLEILAVFAGFLASPALGGVRGWLAKQGRSLKQAEPSRRELVVSTAFGLVASFFLSSLTYWLIDAPDWWVVGGEYVEMLLAAALIIPVVMLSPFLTPRFVRWVLPMVPDEEAEVGAILGFLGLVFGAGVALQLIALLAY